MVKSLMVIREIGRKREVIAEKIKLIPIPLNVEDDLRFNYKNKQGG
ncbi:MAG: hypothetical protein HZC11_04420 [Nitrospirae bacterium]|nr:hypothetical protein [Nitrospirota bacterium]